MGGFLTKEEFTAKADSLVQRNGGTIEDAKNFILSKYEVEGINAKYNPVGTVMNAPESLYDFGKNIVNAVIHLPNTLESTRMLSQGLFSKLAESLGMESQIEADKRKGILTQDRIMEYAKQQSILEEMGKTYYKRGFQDEFPFIDKERTLETLERDPFGLASDFATLVSGIGAGVSSAGKLSRSGKLAAIGGEIAEFGRLFEPTSMIGKFYKGVKSTTKKYVAKFNQRTGVDKYFQRHAGAFSHKALGVTTSEADQIAQKYFGKSAGDVTAELGIAGTPEQMAQQFEELARLSGKSIDDALVKIPTKFKGKVINYILDDIANKFKNVRSKKFVDLKEKITDLQNKLDDEGITLSELNETKKILDKYESLYKESLSIEGIGKTDFVKEGISVKDIENMRSDIQIAIEDQAKKASEFIDDENLGKIRELNRKKYFGTKVGRIVRKNINAMKYRQPFVNQFMASLFGKGGMVVALGALYMGDVSTAVQSIGSAAMMVKIQRMLTKPEKLTAISNFMMSLSNPEFKAFSDAIKTGKKTKLALITSNRFRKTMQELFPELRLGGIISEKHSQGVERSW